MSDCKIHHMDVVSYSGSVMSVIIISEYAKFLELSNSNLSDVGHEVVGDSVGILAHGS